MFKTMNYYKSFFRKHQGSIWLGSLKSGRIENGEKIEEIILVSLICVWLGRGWKSGGK